MPQEAIRLADDVRNHIQGQYDYLEGQKDGAPLEQWDLSKLGSYIAEKRKLDKCAELFQYIYGEEL